MKKGILFALAALCVSAVQAVTINWTDKVGFGTITASGTVTMTIKFVAVADNPLTSSGGSKFSIGSLGFNGNGGELEVNPQGHDKLWTQGDFSDGRLSGNNKAENTFTFVFNIAENGTWTATQYKIEFANGDAEGPKNFTNGRHLVLTTDEISAWTTTGTGTMKMTSATLSGDNLTTSVPEPTALALLALGVAGLTLRRKVA